MTTQNSFLQDYTDKISMVPNDVNRHLRLIRQLDKRLELIQKTLIKDQKDFLSKMKELKDKDKKQLSATMESYNKQAHNGAKPEKISAFKSLPIPLQDVFQEYLKIIKMEEKVVGYAREKSAIASQLSEQVMQYYGILQNQVKSKILKDMTPQDINQSGLRDLSVSELTNFIKKRKQKQTLNNSVGMRKKEEFFYDAKVDKFCYCGDTSFGDMVFCQNLYCQRQWFHLSCINEKSLPDRWFCKQCQAMKDKTKNTISKSYFSLA